MHEIDKLLRGPDTIKGFNKDKKNQYIISKNTDMLKVVWKRLRDRLASVDSSTSTVEITNDYAAHFYDMRINKHDGKHMTGDRMKILLLNLPFLLRDLVAPEARLYIVHDITPDNMIDIVSDVIPRMYNAVVKTVDPARCTSLSLCDLEGIYAIKM